MTFDDLQDHSPCEGSSSEVYRLVDEHEQENSIAPILSRPRARRGSSSSSSRRRRPRAAPRTRCALRTITAARTTASHFSDHELEDTLGVGVSKVRDESPSPVKKPSGVRSVAPRTRAVVAQDKDKDKAGPSRPRVPLATLEYEDPYAEPPKVSGKKGARRVTKEKERGTDKLSEEDLDPKAAVRRLEALLPKSPKKKEPRVGEASKSRAQKEKQVVKEVKGKERENIPESMEGGPGSEDDDDDGMWSDTSPPTSPVRSARGRGEGRGRGSGTGESGEGEGAEAGLPGSRGRSTSRGRPPASKDKGKKRAIEEVDPDEHEERARKRQERIEYFEKLQQYKEDVYMI